METLAGFRITAWICLLFFAEIRYGFGQASAPDVHDVQYGVDSGELYYMCAFTIKTTDQLFYKVTWYQNDVAKYVTDYANVAHLTALRLTETNFQNHGFQLGTVISCEVQSFLHKNGPPSPTSARSPGFFVGLQIQTPSLTFSCHNTDSSSRTIILKQTIPITCSGTAPCEIDLKVSIPEDAQGRCPQIGFEGKQCGIKLSSDNDVNTDIQVTVTCADNGQYMLNDGIYQVYLETADTDETRIWGNYALEPVNVLILPPNNQGAYGKRCESKNDPHMVTGDQKSYELQRNPHEPGTFILYRNLEMKAEVQVQYAPCNSAALCNKAIAVKYGQDVYTITLSNGEMSFGYKVCGDRLLRVKSIGENEYTIIMPYGTYVQVGLQMGWSFLTVFVQLSPADYPAKSFGLCGPVDGIPANDFTDINGNVQSAVPFIESWRVTDNQLNMLEDDFNLGTLTPADLNICVCAHSVINPDAIVECRSNPAAACSNDNDVPQHDCPDMIPSIRKRRSVGQLRKLPVVRVSNSQLLTRKRRQSSQPEWTKALATEFCDGFFDQTALYDMCSDVPNARPYNSKQDCIKDIMLQNGTEWAGSAMENLRLACVSELARNESLSEPQNGGKSLAQAIKEIACPYDCSGSGTCDNVTGTCICDSGYGGIDCSISIHDAIDVSDLLNDGLCNEHETECTVAWVYGFPIVNSVLLTCRLVEFTISNDGTRQNLAPNNVSGIFSTIIEVGCPLESKALPGYFARGFDVRLSNDGGVELSQERELIIYNSVCQVTGTDATGHLTVQLKAGCCFINGSCYNDFEEDGQDNCFMCLPSLSEWTWTWNFHPGCLGSIAIIHGDPHIQTFDGRTYTCSNVGWFYLMYDPDGVYAIVGEFIRMGRRGRRSRLKSMQINYGGTIYYLGQNLQLKVNGIIEPTPYWTWGEIFIYETAHNTIRAILSNGIIIEWDGKNTAVIAVSKLFFWSKTHALCGTYNGNKKDDFTKRNGQKANKNQFVMSWAFP